MEVGGCILQIVKKYVARNNYGDRPYLSKLHLLERNLADWIQLSECELLLYENEKS